MTTERLGPLAQHDFAKGIDGVCERKHDREPLEELRHLLAGIITPDQEYLGARTAG